MMTNVYVRLKNPFHFLMAIPYVMNLNRPRLFWGQSQRRHILYKVFVYDTKTQDGLKRNTINKFISEVLLEIELTSISNMLSKQKQLTEIWEG